MKMYEIKKKSFCGKKILIFLIVWQNDVISNNGTNSPSGHGCCTPTKKAKRPPNYCGYHDEPSDGLYEMIFL